jgi:hypothetical protein
MTASDQLEMLVSIATAPCFKLRTVPTDEGNDFMMKPHESVSQDFKSQVASWYALNIPHALGFPLVFAPGGEGSTRNVNLEILDVDTSPESPTFGQFLLSTEVVGTALIARSDGQSIHTKQIQVLIYYVTGFMEQLTKAKNSEKRYDKKKWTDHLLSKERFKRYWEKCKSSSEPGEAEVWKGAACPID